MSTSMAGRESVRLSTLLDDLNDAASDLEAAAESDKAAAGRRQSVRLSVLLDDLNAAANDLEEAAESGQAAAGRRGSMRMSTLLDDLNAAANDLEAAAESGQAAAGRRGSVRLSVLLDELDDASSNLANAAAGIKAVPSQQQQQQQQQQAPPGPLPLAAPADAQRLRTLVTEAETLRSIVEATKAEFQARQEAAMRKLAEMEAAVNAEREQKAKARELVRINAGVPGPRTSPSLPHPTALPAPHHNSWQPCECRPGSTPRRSRRHSRERRPGPWGVPWG